MALGGAVQDCDEEQSALKTRLMQAAETLDRLADLLGASNEAGRYTDQRVAEVCPGDGTP